MPTFVPPPPDSLHPAARASPGQRAALARALRTEQAALGLCQSALAAFGPVAPWPALAGASGQRLQSLAAQAWRYGLPPPAAPAPQPGPWRAAGWRACLEAGLSGSVASASAYQNLLDVETAPAARQLYQSLQTSLLTQQFPALQSAWQAALDRERYHAQQGIDPSQAYNSHGLIGDTVEQLLALLTRQGGLLGLTGTVLRAAHPALLAGLFTGGAAVQGVRHAHWLRARPPVTSRGTHRAPHPIPQPSQES